MRGRMLYLTAKDIMTRDVVTVRKGTSIDGAARLMAKHEISGLPVVDADGYLVGMITESDILLKGMHAPSELRGSTPGLFAPQPDAVDEAYRRAQSECVEDAMTTDVVIFSEESPVAGIAAAMIEHAINRVPIIEGRKVVGIVSRKDVVKAIAAGTGDYYDPDRHVGRTLKL
ncbi:MAG: CBS domain-containing protein [Armatimonadetes bacterium]|nr:CBS domain-containing protein [Armatimonadota bacterium]